MNQLMNKFAPMSSELFCTKKLLHTKGKMLGSSHNFQNGTILCILRSPSKDILHYLYYNLILVVTVVVFLLIISRILIQTTVSNVINEMG